MKHIIKYPIFVLLLSTMMWSCSDEAVEPFIEAFEIDNFDLVQVTNATPYVPVSISANDDDIVKIEITATLDGESTPKATRTISNVDDNINRITVKLPFPSSDVAPSGIYTIAYTLTDADGNTTSVSYQVNLANTSLAGCDFSSITVPEGKIAIYVTVPNGIPAGDKIHIVGNFMTKNGAAGDWDPGNDDFALTQLSDQCFYIFLDDFAAGDLYKFTRGDWPSESADQNGNAPFDAPAFEGGTELNFIAYNWVDLAKITYPEELPSEAIVTGKLTVVVELDASLSKDDTYYIGPKGTTDAANAVQAVAVSGSNKVAAAVEKSTGVEYVLLKDVNGTLVEGKNVYGFSQSIDWDGAANPITFPVGTFADPAFTLGSKIVIVGGATPGDWGVQSGQDFTKTGDGTYEITITLNGDGEYLLLPDYNQWGDKWAFGSGTPESGTFSAQGSGNNLKAPSTTGSYKIAVDFTTGFGIYTVTAQ